MADTTVNNHMPWIQFATMDTTAEPPVQGKADCRHRLGGGGNELERR